MRRRSLKCSITLKKDDPNYIAALSRLTAARTAYDQAKTNYTYLTDKPSALEVQKNDAKLAIAEAQLADAQRAYDRVKDGPNADDIAAAQAQVDALQATIDTASLIAPISGEVTDTNIQVGDQVSPGSTAIRIDDMGRMLVDVSVSEVDISRIKPGQEATITLDAVSGVTYPGKVTEVAKVADVVQGVANFKVTAQLTQPDENVLTGYDCGSKYHRRQPGKCPAASQPGGAPGRWEENRIRIKKRQT